jgi:hypothetical protein
VVADKEAAGKKRENVGKNSQRRRASTVTHSLVLLRYLRAIPSEKNWRINAGVKYILMVVGREVGGPHA